MTVEFHKMYDLKNVFDEIVPGQYISTNGDEEAATTYFLVGTVKAVEGRVMYVARDDMVQGGEPDHGWWSIIYTPESRIKIVFLRPRHQQEAPKQLACVQQPRFMCTECRFMQSCDSYKTIKAVITARFRKKVNEQLRAGGANVQIQP